MLDLTISLFFKETISPFLISGSLISKYWAIIGTP
jgi:hypothetical protein